MKKKYFYCEDGLTGADCHGVYGVLCIFGDIKNLTGHCPEQPALVYS